MRLRLSMKVIAGSKVGWVLEADLKNFFGSLEHGWLLRFVEHRVGDPRILSVIRRWLKAGVMEDGEVQANEEGTPQGGSVSVVLSNLYLHYVLDLWFERVVKPRLRGEAYLVRYIDDFVVCFQYRSDAQGVQEALGKRLKRFGLALEPDKTKLVEFGRFAQRHASKRGRRRPETIYFLGFTFYCTRNRKGNFKVGMRTEKSRLHRSLARLTELIAPDSSSVDSRASLHSQSGVARPLWLLRCRGEPSRIAEGFSGRGALLAQDAVQSVAARATSLGEVFHRILDRYPLQRPKLVLPHWELRQRVVL